jgi:hypothetical protein
VILECKIDLHIRRCSCCRMWFGAEREFDGRCGNCEGEENRLMRAQLTARDRTIRALKGALKRKRRKP